MDDNDEEVVEMNDKDEIEMLKAQVDSYGHQPRMGAAGVNKTTQVLGKESTKRSGIRRRSRCPSCPYYHGLYTYMRSL